MRLASPRQSAAATKEYSDILNIAVDRLNMAVSLPSGPGRRHERRPQVVHELGEFDAAGRVLAADGGQEDRGAPVGPGLDSAPHPAVGEHEDDDEAGAQEERADPDQRRARIPGDREAAELLLALEGEGDASHGRGHALVDRLAVDQGAVA